MKEINVKLDTPIKYASNGQMVDGQFILIKKPTAKHIGFTTIIRSIFQNNLVEQTKKIQGFAEAVEEAKKVVTADKEKKKKSESEEPDLSWAESIQILYSDPDKVEKITIAFSELMRSGLFLIDGETSMTKPLIDSLDVDDFDKLLGSFVSNFTYASLVKS